jgi:alkylated DNA repair dioxygenase AlkB
VALFDAVYNLNMDNTKNENNRSEGEEPPTKKQKLNHEDHSNTPISTTDNIKASNHATQPSTKDEIQNAQVANPQHFTKEFLHQLRWITLGYHYNWTKRIYQKEHYSPFPRELADLNQKIAQWADTRITPEAAIVNYYHLGTF